jgi:hypothetical protein
MSINPFENITVVPWNLRNKWLNCLALWSHIYSERAICVDKFANLKYAYIQMEWCENHLPSLLPNNFLRNKLGIPYYHTYQIGGM